VLIPPYGMEKQSISLGSGERITYAILQVAHRAVKTIEWQAAMASSYCFMAGSVLRLDTATYLGLSPPKQYIRAALFEYI